MNPTPPPNRCRLVLVAPQFADAADAGALLEQAFSGGDVASLIMPRRQMLDGDYQAVVTAAVEAGQKHGVAIIVEGDARVAMRAGADGLHFEGPKADVADMVERHGRKIMVGTGGVKTRDDALELGEAQPDYMFFGRFDYDNKPEPHPRNLALGEWWSQMVAMPCIVLAGSSPESALTVAAAGAEFVALGAAVFGDGADPAEAVRSLNAMLDDDAPRLDA